MRQMILYTDGACRGNPGPGGWGVWICDADRFDALKGAEANTTNNRMELTAAIEALQYVRVGETMQLVTDSTYVKNGITTWIHGWRKRGWRTSQGQPVKNQDLWQRLHELACERQVQWTWVKGHNGDEGNEHADRLANEAIDALTGGRQ